MNEYMSHDLYELDGAGARRPRKGKGARRFLAVALAVVLLAGMVLGGVSVYGGMNDRLAQQASQIEALSKLVASQQTQLAQTSDILGETQTALAQTLDAATLAGKAEALSNTAGAAAEAPAGVAAGGTVAQTALLKGSSVTDIAEAVGPSVVGIRMTVNMNSRRFQTSTNSSEGSGIVISSDGYVATNHHVVSYADPASAYSEYTTLEVFLPDGRTAKAEFVGGDSENDLAVIKIPLTGLAAAELGTSANLKVGELAVAIGNPLGMEFAGSVTVGVVSALNRKLDGEETSINLIQTDAAINPGNSGGALVNSQGQIIGINTAKIAQTGVEGIGFAIAIDDAKPILSSLIAYGYVRNRPYLGIGGQDITEVMAGMYDVPMGVYVSSVDPDGGAHKAGVQVGDIIVGLAGQDVTTMSEINAIKKSHKAGDTVAMTVVRGTKTLSLKVTFTEAR